MRSGESRLVTSAHEIFMGTNATGAPVGDVLSVLRTSVRNMSSVAIHELGANVRAAHDAFAAADLSWLTRTELVSVMDELETLDCQLPTQWHRMLSRLQYDTTPK